ncbi:c6 transcription factor [Moniliophthora roreri]|nr:c6 transcription factor [Moniliophthora roreri]
MSTRGGTTFEGVIRFHTRSRTGCLTCRKRKIKKLPSTQSCLCTKAQKRTESAVAARNSTL